MIGVEELLELVRAARWDGLVMFGEALWIAVLANWWVGPILLILVITSSRRALLKMSSQVGGIFFRSQL